MTTLRLYNLFRRAGNSPCQALRLANAAQPGHFASAACYAGAICVAIGTVLLFVLR